MSLEIVASTVKDIWLNIEEVVRTRFVSPNESEIAWQYIAVNIVIFVFLIRFGLSVDYLNKSKPKVKGKRPFFETLRSIFSKEIFLSRSFLSDLGIYATNLVLFGFLSVVISSAITDPQPFLSKFFGQFFTRPAGHLAFQASATVQNIVFTSILFVVYETLYYFSHRAFHSIPILWHFHKVHHSATRLSFMTDNRFHAVEWFCLGICEGLSAAFAKTFCVYLFGSMPEIVAINGIAIHYAILYTLTLAQHSNLWFSFGRFEYVVLSPAMHIMHHSTNSENFNTNYALNFSTLDYIFGTFKGTAKTPPENLQIGVGADEKENSYWAQTSVTSYFFRPFKDAFITVFKKQKAD